MDTGNTTTEKKPGFIALRIFAGFFLFGAVKNGFDLVLDEYHQEPLLWIQYLSLTASMIGIFLLYRWAYFLFLVVVIYTLVVFQFLPPNSPDFIRICFGMIGPMIISALMLPRWKWLR